MKKITVLGGGNGGQALAGHLASKGFSVTLFEHPDFEEKISHLKATKTIRLTGTLSATGKLACVTTDPREALEGANILYFLAPSFAQKAMFDILTPHFSPRQLLFLMPGNFGSLTLRNSMKGNGLPEKFIIAESDTMPYACRLEEPGVVNIWGMKSFMTIAALPMESTSFFITGIQEYFPIPVKRAPNVLSIGLSNTNMILHCPTMIMNAGRIESGNGGFSFYAEGMTEAVCAIMEAMDKERIAIGEALGLNLLSTMEDMKEIYSLTGKNLREVILNNIAYCGHGTDSPSSMKYRYLTEDVPFLLVPAAALGKSLGVNTPTMDGLIHMASVIIGEEYKKTGRTLEEIGWQETSALDFLRSM